MDNLKPEKPPPSQNSSSPEGTFSVPVGKVSLGGTCRDPGGGGAPRQCDQGENAARAPCSLLGEFPGGLIRTPCSGQTSTEPGAPAALAPALPQPVEGQVAPALAAQAPQRWHFRCPLMRARGHSRGASPGLHSSSENSLEREEQRGRRTVWSPGCSGGCGVLAKEHPHSLYSLDTPGLGSASSAALQHSPHRAPLSARAPGHGAEGARAPARVPGQLEAGGKVQADH